MIILLNKYKSWLVLILLLGCTVSTNNHAMVEYSENDKVVDDFIHDGFIPSILFSNQKDKFVKILIKHFGSPILTKMEIVSDSRRSSQKNEESTYHYDGLVIKTSTPLISKKLTTWVTYVHLTSDKYQLRYGLNIGSKRNEFVKMLGHTYINSQFKLKYQTSEHASTGNVEVIFDKSLKAKEITWEFYAD